MCMGRGAAVAGRFLGLGQSLSSEYPQTGQVRVLPLSEASSVTPSSVQLGQLMKVSSMSVKSPVSVFWSVPVLFPPGALAPVGALETFVSG